MATVVKLYTGKWGRGNIRLDKLEYISQLYNPNTGLSCCLGLACLQVGIPQDWISGFGGLGELYGDYSGRIDVVEELFVRSEDMVQRGAHAEEAWGLLYRINDNMKLEPQEYGLLSEEQQTRFAERFEADADGIIHITSDLKRVSMLNYTCELCFPNLRFVLETSDAVA